jgi:hypothetical protein
MRPPACFTDPVPETALLSEEIAGRPKELVFITEDPTGAAALRRFGVLAVARPDGGRWGNNELAPLVNRDLAILRTEPFGTNGWCERDRRELALTARRVGIVTPDAFEGVNPPRDLAELVSRLIGLGFGPVGLVAEALAKLEDTMPRVDRPSANGQCGGDTAPARPRYKLTTAADVTCLPVEWLWRDRVPLGMLTLFAGDPKLGKSFVTIALAAAASRGAALPGDDPPAAPGSVVVLSAEDDPARTIVPRLKSAGADLARVHILEAVYLSDGSEALPSLRADTDTIEQAVSSLNDCRLVIVDPVSAYLGGTDDHKNAELRGVLSPLKGLAERIGAAVVLVTHLNKGGGTNGKHRVTGSIAYVGACRANFLFVRDRDDPTGRRVLMLANGCNLSPDVPTLAYRIEDRGEGPTVEWEAEPVRITAEQALAAETGDDHERTEARECDDWLRETLADGPVAAVDIYKAARDAGFSQDQAKRAKRRIGARSERQGFGPDSKCHWRLPDGDPGRSGVPIECA